MTSSASATARPRYLHIKEYVRSRVMSGAWPTGHRVPSENELVERFRVARMTANRALRELQQEGLLVRRAGVGTFVAAPERQSSLIDIRNVAAEIRARGRHHRAEVRRTRRVRATQPMKASFELEPGAEADLFHVVLVHREDDLPVQLEDRLVNAELVPDFLDHDFTRTTPTEVLLGALRPHELEHTVDAVLPNRRQQKLLEIAAEQPCLSLRRRSWSSGRVVTVATLLYPANRTTLTSRHQPSRTHHS